MSNHALCGNLGYANRVAMDFADKRALPKEMAREYLQMGARAIMQMWHDLEQEEPIDVMKRIKSKLDKQRKAIA